MPFYILLFLYLAPVCLALYWLTKLVVWIIKKVFQLVIWIVKYRDERYKDILCPAQQAVVWFSLHR